MSTAGPACPQHPPHGLFRDGALAELVGNALKIELEGSVGAGGGAGCRRRLAQQGGESTAPPLSNNPYGALLSAGEGRGSVMALVGWESFGKRRRCECAVEWGHPVGSPVWDGDGVGVSDGDWRWGLEIGMGFGGGDRDGDRVGVGVGGGDKD